ncbi:thymidylate synthase family protein [Sphingobacterium endophyticum]|uniref:thymidylate synthase n=1 Tax=Sphingobacterium endophyticum TaxID=2546448 RepID=UPI0012E119B0|nr:thymidylate synthase [Sphingobacterium endophyticum]
MSIPVLIEEKNLSKAWYKVLQHIIDHSGNEITPLILTLSEFAEDKLIKNQLNIDLSQNELDSIEIVSETIFPQSLYLFNKGNRGDLFDNYLKNVLPRLKKIDQRNSSGTYFERLIAFGDTRKNQLEIIIDSLKEESKIKRRSKSQAAIFDPLKDHKNGMFQSFPCLQHVTFYKSENGGLIINSFYAMQYLYQRAYGNWLGLINLGKFVAQETGLELERFNCFVGVEKLDHLTKAQAKTLISKMTVEN